MPEKITVKTAAKINLALDVTGKLPNGYHTIESVFQTVGIYDTVTVELNENGEITVTCDVPEIPCNEKNIAYKAARLFLDENKLKNGCNIDIRKKIPSQAGMGGGSSDAAAVIYCLERLTGKTLANPERIGADVPFFLTGGTAYVEGIGEKVTPIADYSGKILVIAKGKEGVSTAEAYRLVDTEERIIEIQVKQLVKAIEENSDNEYKYFRNAFEYVIDLEEVDYIEEFMFDRKALAQCMTGSGSAVFGLFDTMEKAEKCADSLRKAGFFAEVCKTVDKSFIEIK